VLWKTRGTYFFALKSMAGIQLKMDGWISHKTEITANTLFVSFQTV
jgi:hypothetical protein